MFGFGKKKQEFNTLHYAGVEMNSIVLQLKNDKGDTKLLYLPIKTVAKYLPQNERVVEKIVTKTQSSIWHVLGIMPTTDKDKVISAYRKMSTVYHPDCGGTSSSFNTLNNAKDKALQQCK